MFARFFRSAKERNAADIATLTNVRVIARDKTYPDQNPLGSPIFTLAQFWALLLAAVTTPFRSTSATDGIGYAAGAGGAVTQLTSKSTGVTVNATTGAITLHNAALADATNVTFTVTNAAAEANDVPVVVHKSAGTLGSYQAWAHSPAAGSFKITVRNVSGGSLGEAIVLQFALVRGAVA